MAGAARIFRAAETFQNILPDEDIYGNQHEGAGTLVEEVGTALTGDQFKDEDHYNFNTDSHRAYQVGKSFGDIVGLGKLGGQVTSIFGAGVGAIKDAFGGKQKEFSLPDDLTDQSRRVKQLAGHVVDRDYDYFRSNPGAAKMRDYIIRNKAKLKGKLRSNYHGKDADDFERYIDAVSGQGGVELDWNEMDTYQQKKFRTRQHLVDTAPDAWKTHNKKLAVLDKLKEEGAVNEEEYGKAKNRLRNAYEDREPILDDPNYLSEDLLSHIKKARVNREAVDGVVARKTPTAVLGNEPVTRHTIPSHPITYQHDLQRLQHSDPTPRYRHQHHRHRHHHHAKRLSNLMQQRRHYRRAPRHNHYHTHRARQRHHYHHPSSVYDY